MRHATIVLALLAVIPLTADAKPKGKGKGKDKAKVTAKVHMDRAAKAHKAGQFDVALVELQAAYDMKPQPKLLFAIAQVQQKLDNCPAAVPNYEKFLASTKDKQKQAVVKQAIAACNTKIAAAPATPVEPTPPADPVVATIGTTSNPGTPPVEPTPAPIDPVPVVDNSPPLPEDNPLPPGPGIGGSASVQAKPWYKDPLGDMLVLSGVAAGAASIVFYVGARSALDDGESASTLAEYESLVDDAKSKRSLSVVFAGGSAVLIGAGLLRYALRDSGETRGVAIAPTRGGGFVTWTGGF
jgi:hypothetical protein